MERRPSDTVFLCLLRALRSVAVLTISRSSHGHISFGDGYSVVGCLSPPHKGMNGKGRFYGYCRENFLPQGVDHGKAEKLSLPEENFQSPSLGKGKKLPLFVGISKKYF